MKKNYFKGITVPMCALKNQYLNIQKFRYGFQKKNKLLKEFALRKMSHNVDTVACNFKFKCTIVGCMIAFSLMRLVLVSNTGIHFSLACF